MPIVGSGDNVHIEYTIPEEIRSLITDKFLKEFLYQLIRISGLSPYDFADDIVYTEGTGAWYAAFGKACIETNNAELYNYWLSLEWYDSDIFDGELVDILFERKFILGYRLDVVSRELGMDANEIDTCSECGKYMKKNILIKDGEEYMCPYCMDVKNGDRYKNGSTDYYRETCREVDEYCRRIKDV